MIRHYNISDELQVKVRTEENLCQIPADTLFSMAARKNKKRSFLFVSKILGKHIPVAPGIMLLGGMSLAAMYYENLSGADNSRSGDIIAALKNGRPPDAACRAAAANRFPLSRPTLFMGFAETATALGHIVFESFSDNAAYIHTTREHLADAKNAIAFEETHSHATSHRIYPQNCPMLASDCPLVLIDDEITTGNTSLNTIEAVHAMHPRKQYAVLSILDWRTRENKAAFAEKEKALGIEIRTLSLMRGNIEVNGTGPHMTPSCPTGFQPQGNHRGIAPAVEYLNLDSFFNEFLSYASADSTGTENTTPYIRHTGRFGICSEDNQRAEALLKDAGDYLRRFRQGGKTLCVGTGEFMYLPMKIATHMGDGVLYQSTTRSPIHPRDTEGYGARNRLKFKSPDDPNLLNYLYNIPFGAYDDIFVFLEREVDSERMIPLTEQLKTRGVRKIFIVICSKNRDALPTPEHMGSYPPEDVIFLLRDVSDLIQEQGNEEREKAIQSGVHYSEMIPIEYRPSPEYMRIFHDSMKKYKKKIAIATGIVSEHIIRKRGRNIVLVSLARAGIPAGVLIRRYLKHKFGISVPHYSISIIRGKGIDENAIRYILKHHPKLELQFIDGWTGKGSITKELNQACEAFEKKWGIPLNPDMGVIADPGYCASLFGTREDFMIPSACLNSTVSGLLSRTIHRTDLVGEDDFHGVKFYRELIDEDVSNLFVDSVTACYPNVVEKIEEGVRLASESPVEVPWLGMEDVDKIQKDFNIENVHFVKPGIGETTRVLLRRIPWKVLVAPHAKNLDHILQLAKEKNIPTEEYPLSAYHCCGVIRSLRKKSSC